MPVTRRLTVASWEAMVSSLLASRNRQAKILADTEEKLAVSQQMLEEARKEAAQSDLVAQAGARVPASSPSAKAT